jgi:hypothetical protein
MFEKMIGDNVSLTKCFPEYDGGSDTKTALKFIQNEFERRMENNNKQRLHVHYVAARYNKDISVAWRDIKEVVINDKHMAEANKAKGKQSHRK